jgi:DNA invertase Pin-like site-specific DNA recombinase
VTPPGADAFGTGARPDKITARHRERRAYVYVRQSTLQQVEHHRESQAYQYDLVQRACALGWPPERVQVVDADLGHSGQDGRRPGFQELVAAVSLGQVGLVLAYEASRLARNNADWYRLLDLAAVVGALIADADGVYDPRQYNDRLLLGLRGMLSEAELHLLQLRLAAGRRRQIERGDYRQHLPTGLVRLEDGRVVKDPDRQIQGAVALVFERFLALGSCHRVVRRLRDEGVLLPRRYAAGPRAGELRWQRPSVAAVYGMLRNPAYAGAFAYGRRGPSPTGRLGPSGRVARRLRTAPEAWAVLHRDVYPAYVPWARYLAIQQRLTDNAARAALWARGAPRAGAALLAGLAVCGRCGHQVRVAYKACHRYVCNALGEEYGDRMCLSVDGPSLDAAVVATFFAALAPAELALLDDVLAAQQTQLQRLARQHADQVVRAEYEARLAQRRYQAIDPENRLVAAELERRWELALRAVAEAREAAARFDRTPAAPALEPALRAQLGDLGRRLPGLWRSGRLTPAHQKELLRSLVRRVVVTRPAPDSVAATVLWVSGAGTTLTVRPPVHRSADLREYPRLVERALALAAAGHQDPEVARRLTAEGFRSAHRPDVPTTLVERIRRVHGLVSLTERFRRDDRIDGAWTVGGLARALDVSAEWLRQRIADGTVPAQRHAATGRYLIPDDPVAVARLRARAAARHP